MALFPCNPKYAVKEDIVKAILRAIDNNFASEKSPKGAVYSEQVGQAMDPRKERQLQTQRYEKGQQSEQEYAVFLLAHLSERTTPMSQYVLVTPHKPSLFSSHLILLLELHSTRPLK